MSTAPNYELIDSPGPTQAQEHAAPVHPMAISVVCHEHEVPSFVEKDLVRLYGNIFSTLAKFRVYGSAEQASTYVVRRGDEVITVFLFHRTGRRVSVLNEFIDADRDDLTRFADYIFARYREVSTISFSLVQAGFRALAYPHQRINCNEDIVLTLPESVEAYRAMLGRSTRQNINYYRNRLKREHPSFAYEIQEKEAIDDTQFRQLMALSRARMASKDKAHGFGERETALLISLAKVTGMIGIVKIDDRICAGAICYRAGDNFFLYVITHDSAFNDYGLGTYCCYLTICECIARGGAEFHFLWGREEYKYRLLGEQRDFDSLTIYRSRAHLLRDGRAVAKTALKSWTRQAMLWLLSPERRNSPLTQAAIKMVRTMRRLKQPRQASPIKQK